MELLFAQGMDGLDIAVAKTFSGTPIHNGRYAYIKYNTGFAKNGFFVSNPFYELGAEK